MLFVSYRHTDGFGTTYADMSVDLLFSIGVKAIEKQLALAGNIQTANISYFQELPTETKEEKSQCFVTFVVSSGVQKNAIIEVQVKKGKDFIEEIREGIKSYLKLEKIAKIANSNHLAADKLLKLIETEIEFVLISYILK